MRCSERGSSLHYAGTGAILNRKGSEADPGDGGLEPALDGAGQALSPEGARRAGVEHAKQCRHPVSLSRKRTGHEDSFEHGETHEAGTCPMPVREFALQRRA